MLCLDIANGQKPSEIARTIKKSKTSRPSSISDITSASKPPGPLAEPAARTLGVSCACSVVPSFPYHFSFMLYRKRLRGRIVAELSVCSSVSQTSNLFILAFFMYMSMHVFSATRRRRREEEKNLSTLSMLNVVWLPSFCAHPCPSFPWRMFSPSKRLRIVCARPNPQPQNPTLEALEKTANHQYQQWPCLIIPKRDRFMRRLRTGL